jgi:putative sigma-54 modulation protein
LDWHCGWGAATVGVVKLIISPHNLKLTKAIEDRLVDRIQKLEHLDHRAIDARVILEHNTSKPTDRRFKVAIRLAVRGPDLYAETYQSDLYSAIDIVTKKIEQQIRTRHNRRKARKQAEGAKVKLRRQEQALQSS